MDLQGLNFRPSLGIQATINSKFGCLVSQDVSSGAFFLVASFGRCKFKLCPVSVSLLLQATIGGLAKDFGVVPLSDSVFHFSVSSRLVGFHVFKLWFFSCTLYKVYFHLWSNGGPRWIPEWIAFYVEEEKQQGQTCFQLHQAECLFCGCSKTHSSHGS